MFKNATYEERRTFVSKARTMVDNLDVTLPPKLGLLLNPYESKAGSEVVGRIVPVTA